MFQTLQSAAVAFVLDEPRIGELFLRSDSAWPFCFTQVNRPHRYCGGMWRTLSKDQRPSGLCELVTHTPGHYHRIYSETKRPVSLFPSTTNRLLNAHLVGFQEGHPSRHGHR